MAFFSIGLGMAATIYIQANSLKEARGKLQPLFSKQIDARDGRWFSDASFGSPALPEVSFATAMAIRWAVPGEVCQAIEADEVDRLMRSSPDAQKSTVVPSSTDRLGVRRASLYWADLLVRTTGILKVQRLSNGLALLAALPSTCVGVHWELADKWFELEGFDNTDFPLVLSPNITVLAESDELPLQEHWSVAESRTPSASETFSD
ncbi:hypothetical protein [Neorhizobium sp. DAR64872/K0K18]|uniref:hypothetical protein n=1 Tax=Neorhizobium sp. DAR64872/K0K18 TaxID=3421958 RepID=UPI003D2E0F9D